MRHYRADQKQAWLLLTPWLVASTLLIFLPALLSLLLIFTNYDALTSASWNGVNHLTALLGDPLFVSGLASTLFYVGAVVAGRTLIALALAAVLQRPRRVQQAAALLVFLPSVIPEVAYVLIWLLAFNPRFGSINLLLRQLALPAPQWLVEPWSARWALVIMGLWLVGETFVVLLVSLRDIPLMLYDSAEIDGASHWTKFRHITLPLLSTRLLLLTARDLLVATHASFLPTLLLTKGGPGNATLFVPLYGWLLAFEDLRFGYAAAAVWLLYGLLGAVIWLLYRGLRSRLYVGAFR